MTEPKNPPAGTKGESGEESEPLIYTESVFKGALAKQERGFQQTIRRTQQERDEARQAQSALYDLQEGFITVLKALKDSAAGEQAPDFDGIIKSGEEKLKSGRDNSKLSETGQAFLNRLERLREKLGVEVDIMTDPVFNKVKELAKAGKVVEAMDAGEEVLESLRKPPTEPPKPTEAERKRALAGGEITKPAGGSRPEFKDPDAKLVWGFNQLKKT